MTNKNGSFKQKKVYFSQVSNTALRDNNLSLKAKGLYALIQSYITIENFTLYKNTLKKNCSEGSKAFESTWKELKDKGYLIQERHQNEDGKFYYLYDLLDVPNHTPKKEGTVKRVYGKGGIYSNNDFINTDSNNTLNNNLHCLDELNNDRFISFYLKTMNQYGLKHKRINENNFNYILKAIEILDMDVDIDDWEEAVEKHFEKLPKNNDGDILSFLKASARHFGVDVYTLAKTK
jgi:hypothetical protein